ncbi:dipeptidase [Candidatus Palauibacter sp.]|uniref:dipeptidase n=1 Tax=Candidatus Palauibacter sp. TaxID=3101350 RepID=UPI003C6F234E
MSDFCAYIDRELPRFHEELETLLRIPSISTDPECAGDVRACAEWVAEHLAAAGVPGAEVIETGGHPIVVAERIQAADAPTVLVYGHYDVQPSEPDELWSSPPFEPTVRDGRLYARGAVDDKGQVHMHIKALEARLATGAGVPVNLKLVIEGEEEVGSRHLAAFLSENAERLACDAVLISDTGMFSPDLPCITTGLRGIVYTEINVFGPASDLHSGSYGGAVVNPANALAAILAGLRDDRGRATVPGYYDAVRPITERERADLERLPMDDETLRAGVGAPALGGEAGFSALERLWYRPTLDVNGMLSGFTGEGSKTVLPSRAMAKVSMRLVPDQDPAQVIEAFEARVHELAPEGVTVEIKRSHGGAPWVADTAHPIFDAASAALESGFGAPPAFVREGGSIPIVQAFEETFEAPALLIGFALPGCNMHAPDEWLDLGVYRNGIAALADLYGRLTDGLS